MTKCVLEDLSSSEHGSVPPLAERVCRQDRRLPQQSLEVEGSSSRLVASLILLAGLA